MPVILRIPHDLPKHFLTNLSSLRFQYLPSALFSQGGLPSDNEAPLGKAHPQAQGVEKNCQIPSRNGLPGQEWRSSNHPGPEGRLVQNSRIPGLFTQGK